MLTRLATAALLARALALPELTLSKKSYADLGLPDHLAKRAVSGSGTLQTNPYSVLTWSTGGAYYVNITAGTPPQNQVVLLDTGSSDLYLDASSAPACQNTASQYSCRGGTFNPSNSNTYKVVDPSPAFNTSFGDGSTASGPYSDDTIGIGDVVVQNVQFGVAEQVNSTTGYAIGLMGVGYSIIEGTQDFYPNMPEVLADAGVINSRLYSIQLNDVNTGSGSILFGGVDTSKFNAPLVTVNLLPDPYSVLTSGQTPVINQFITTVTQFGVSVGGNSATIISGGTDSVTAYTSSNSALAVLLDTGSTAWSVPKSVFSSILKQFTYVDKYGLCPCSHRDSGDTLTLTFAGKVKITVPAQEFIVPIYNATTRQPYPYDNAGNFACEFMISAGGDDAFLTLGDAVLRSMYVVFDLDQGQVSLAQANVNSTASSNIVKIPAGHNGVASAVSGASAAAHTQSYSIAAPVTATQTYVASTVASTLGTATGADAVPTEARTAAYASSKAAAANVQVPGVSAGVVLSLTWIACMAVFGTVLL